MKYEPFHFLYWVMDDLLCCTYEVKFPKIFQSNDIFEDDRHVLRLNWKVHAVCLIIFIWKKKLYKLICNIYVRWSLSVINVLIKYDVTPAVSISHKIFNCVYSNSFLVRELCKSDHLNSRWSELKDCHVHICSENNFPTAAGLASSAAGYSCLGTCI